MARYADAWNTAWFGSPDERLQTRLALVGEALEADGRDAGTLRRTVGLHVIDPDVAPAEDGAFTGSVAELTETLGRFEALGFADAIAVVEPMNVRSLERLAEAAWRNGEKGLLGTS